MKLFQPRWVLPLGRSNESSDSVRRLVHSLCALLAGGLAGTGAVSVDMVGLVALKAYLLMTLVLPPGIHETLMNTG